MDEIFGNQLHGPRSHKGTPKGQLGIHQTNHFVAFFRCHATQNTTLKPKEKGVKLNIMLHLEQIQSPAVPPVRKEPRHSMIHLEPVEVLSVLRAARSKGSREWAMILLAYKHGMRASEVCNLRLDDVDMKNGSIVVERLKGSLRTTQAVTEHRGEPLLNELKALREWLRQRRDDGSDYLFTSQKGGRLDRSQFFRLFQAIASKAGMSNEKQHPHDQTGLLYQAEC